ncbi:hypothetical protein M1V55_27430, partial [Escherichia coli]|nr:hypothetical protein [Escherichia coli]
HTNRPLTDFGGKTSIFSHPVYLFLREFSLQDFRGGSDIDPLMVKCCMIQLFHYFESRNTTPKTLSIVGIDTLSRRTKNIAYYAEKPPATAATVAA